jgi:hypothetical protein
MKPESEQLVSRSQSSLQEAEMLMAGRAAWSRSDYGNLQMPITAGMGKEEFHWFDLDEANDLAAYQSYWNTSTYRRPHDHPGYLELVRPQNFSPVVALYEHHRKARISYPFFYCDLGKLVPFCHMATPWRHVVSPYGYGGPVYEGDPAYWLDASEAFEKYFTEELQKRHVVSEFVREDLFSHRLAKRTLGHIENHPNVMVKLDLSPDDAWRNYAHSVRSNIKRAWKCGLRAEFDQEGKGLDHFLHIYHETMARRAAPPSFYFSKERFLHLMDTLGQTGAVTFVHVYDQDDIVSSELLLTAGDVIYSFLGGSLASAFAKRPNNLLKHEVILHGGRLGCKWLVLGGGLSANDELFRFKHSFDPHHVVPFTMRRIIYNQPAYDALVAAQCEHERRQGKQWVPKAGFFPEYLPAEDHEKRGQPPVACSAGG